MYDKLKKIKSLKTSATHFKNSKQWLRHCHPKGCVIRDMVILFVVTSTTYFKIQYLNVYIRQSEL